MRLGCRPTISQARAIHSSLPEVRAVIVLAFTDDDVAGASYGDTKTECNQIGYREWCQYALEVIAAAAWIKR